MKTILSVVVSAMCIAFAASAQTSSSGGGGGGGGAPSQLPIRNIEQLWVWALNQASQGQVGVWGENLSENSNNTNYVQVLLSQDVTGANHQTIADKLGSAVLDFAITDTNGLYAYLNLFDRKGRQLFYGSEAAYVVPAELGRFRLVAGKIKPRIVDEVYFAYQGASWARFVQKTKEGFIIRTVNIPVVDGEIRFPVGLIGNVEEYRDSGQFEDSYGELSVFVQDSDGYHEDTFRGGVLVTPERVSGTANVAFANFRPLLVNPSEIRGEAEETSPQFVQPVLFTARLKVTIFPSTGYRFVNGQVEILTHACKGQLLDGKGRFLGEFSTSESAPVSGELDAGLYYIILDDWEDPDFGRNYRERHHVPSEDNTTTPGKG
ncbi:MAG: hypothetical protein HYV67_01795 [Candidatus Taylorbacteria bacterium]|nr:hypothetical protein [Candidatus Taylorbacteria bacterium]